MKEDEEQSGLRLCRTISTLNLNAQSLGYHEAHHRNMRREFLQQRQIVGDEAARQMVAENSKNPSILKIMQHDAEKAAEDQKRSEYQAILQGRKGDCASHPYPLKLFDRRRPPDGNGVLLESDESMIFS